MASTLHWVDYTIFLSFLAISLGIGVFHALTGGRQRTTGEFLMGNRKLMVIPTVLSMTMSYMSAIMVVGQVSEIYSYGIGAAVFLLVHGFTAAVLIERFIVPWLYPLKLVSVYTYLEKRYRSKAVQLFGAFLGILNGILYIGIAIVAPSISLESVSGLPMYISIPVMAGLATIYTALGGMKAVIWTDVFQSAVMLAGIITVLVKAITLAGGPGEAFSLAEREGRMTVLRWTADPRERNTVWSLSAMAIITSFSIKGVGQMTVQRYCAISTLRKARLSILGDALMAAVVYTLVGMMGVSVFGYFARQQCDPLLAGQVRSTNQFVKIAFESNLGFTGLFIATLYSGSLSTVSSCLSGAAANIWEDLLLWKFKNTSPERATAINKGLVVLVGVTGTGFAFMAAAMPGPIIQVCNSFFGACGGPLLGLFLTGGALRCINWIGALSGGVVGFGLNLWVSVGAMTVPPYTPRLPPVSTEHCASINLSLLEPPLSAHNASYQLTPQQEGSPLQLFYQLCFMWYGLLGLVTTASVSVVVSCVTNKLFPHLEDELKDIPREVFIPWRAALTFGSLCSAEDSEVKSAIEYSRCLGKSGDGGVDFPNKTSSL